VLICGQKISLPLGVSAPLTPTICIALQLLFLFKKNMNKQEQMFALVGQWRESGISRKAFADQHNITGKSFDYWCRKQFNEVVKPRSPIKASPKSPVNSPGFVELTSGQDVFLRKQPVRMELELPGGIHIKIY
jgi:hypothetical protein